VFAFKVFNSPSILFPFSVGTDLKKFNPLFEVLSEGDRQWDGAPFREFKIRAVRKSSPGPGRSTEPWSCAFDVQFKEDGKIGLWNATANEKNILDINMSCLEKLVSLNIIYFIIIDVFRTF
jgi:hypothetical protein